MEKNKLDYAGKSKTGSLKGEQMYLAYISLEYL